MSVPRRGLPSLAAEEHSHRSHSNRTAGSPGEGRAHPRRAFSPSQAQGPPNGAWDIQGPADVILGFGRAHTAGPACAARRWECGSLPTWMPVDPRDASWDVAIPTYRVHFWSEDGTACDEWRMTDAANVHEVLVRAAKHVGALGGDYRVFVEVTNHCGKRSESPSWGPGNGHLDAQVAFGAQVPPSIESSVLGVVLEMEVVEGWYPHSRRYCMSRSRYRGPSWGSLVRVALMAVCRASGRSAAICPTRSRRRSVGMLARRARRSKLAGVTLPGAARRWQLRGCAVRDRPRWGRMAVSWTGRRGGRAWSAPRPAAVRNSWRGRRRHLTGS